MAECWYGDKMIANFDLDIVPDVGDQLQLHYEGELRDFSVERKYKYYASEQQPSLRLELKAVGGWAMMLAIG